MVEGTRSEQKPFVHDGRAAVHSLRRAIAAVMSSVGAEIDEPQEMARRFGLDKTLSWRLSRLVREEDPWEALQHIPGRPGMGIFAGVMETSGAPADRLAAMWEAVDGFERFVRTHTRDRETLEMMVGGTARRSAERRMESFRKAGFLSNSAILGVKAVTQVCAHMIAPSRTPGMADMGVISGLSEFCRLRPNVPWAVATVRNWGGASASMTGESAAAPVDETTRAGEAPLMKEFCSQPVPDVRVAEHPKGTYRCMLTDGPLGYSAAATVISGWVYHATAPLSESYPGEPGEHGANLTTPVEALVFDLFVHRDLPFARSVTARVYSQLPGGPRYAEEGATAYELPVPTEIVDMEDGPPDPPSPALGRYAEMIGRVAGRMGRAAEDFSVLRYRLRYPPIPALALLTHPLRRGS